MSGTTTVHHYPYPTDGDLVAQTDEAIQALAEAVDPLGLVAIATRTADQGGVTGEVDVTGLSVTFTVAANRRIRLALTMRVDSTVAGDTVRLYIKEGGTVVQTIDARLGAALVGDTMVGWTVITPSAGAHTYKATIQRVLGTGTLTSRATATNPAHLIAEDLGPA